MKTGRKSNVLMGCALPMVMMLLFSCTDSQNTTNYYFDPISGDDSNIGTSAKHPFKSLTNISNLIIKPGDSILLKGGSDFSEGLSITCHGTSERPIVIGKYGSQERAVISADGVSEATVHILNSEYIVIRDLEISNDAGKPVPGLHGLWVELRNYGTAHGITIDNLYVHDVSGSCAREEKDGGHAVYIQNYHEDMPDSILSCFDGLIIENCHIRNCRRSGIIFWGNWIRSKWKPSTNVVIRHNLLEGIPGDGIVPVGCDGVVVEYNIMKDCPGTLPETEAADGIWPWSCDNAIVQFNVVSDHKSPTDAYGFDSDWNSTNSLFQFNLSYNNDGGFLLVCNSGGWTPDWCIGNKGTIARYNISINDGLRRNKLKGKYFSPVIHCAGPISNTIIENNLIYLFAKPNKLTDRTLISLTDWTGYPDSTFFNNNYIYTAEGYHIVDQGKSTNTIFGDNLYVGNLTGSSKGFKKYPGLFNQDMWYDEADENWNKLFMFVRDKTVLINDTEMKVTAIIGKDSVD